MAQKTSIIQDHLFHLILQYIGCRINVNDIPRRLALLILHSFIPKGTEYPKDRRVKTGEYRNWRQIVKLRAKHPEILKMLCQMSESIGTVYGESITEVILYGSYARCQETDESDIDMALVLKDSQTDEQYDRITDIVVDYELDLGVTLSIIPINLRDFIEWKTTLPFYKNIDKEGIVLWKNT